MNTRSSPLLVSGQLCTKDKTTKKSDVSTLQTMFQSGQTRPESTEREKQAEREASRERDKQRGELTERGGIDKE